MEQATAPMGHNNPPAEEVMRDQLMSRWEELTNRVKQLLEASERVPEKIEDEETFAKTGDFVKQLRTAAKKADDARTLEKKPYLDAGRLVDGFFKRLTDDLDKARKTVQRRMDKYTADKVAEQRQRDEEAREAAMKAGEEVSAENKSAADAVRTRSDFGSTVSARTVVEFDIQDASKIPAAILKKYIGKDDLEKVIRAAVRAGERDIKGVHIFETTKALVR